MKVSSALISFVAGSKRRIEILTKLNENETSQAELLKITGMYKGHVSRNLLELSKMKLIKCTNPKDRAFKFYKITTFGQKVIKEVERIG